MCFGKERYFKKNHTAFSMLECSFLVAQVCGHNELGLLPVDSNKLFERLSARPEGRITSEFAQFGCKMETTSMTLANVIDVCVR